MLKVIELTGGYHHTPILHQLSFEVEKGELYGILGPNGSGKTTLLNMMSGILSYDKGEILLKGKRLEQYAAKELARVIAVLPQHSSQAFSYTVKETVSLGRYAHQRGLFHSWTLEDEEVVQRVMGQTGVSTFQDVQLHQLSGGERQRVLLAQALAQEPEILFLDEPTNHLDLSYQKDLLDLMRKWTKEKGLTVISIFHDLNLAGLYCDRLLLLEKGRINCNAKPNEVLQKKRIEAVYQTDIEKHPHPVYPKPQMFIVPEKYKDEDNEVTINQQHLTISSERVELKAPIPLKTLSSGITGAGMGWHENFVNRQVNHNYNCVDHLAEMAQYLESNGFDSQETVGMMTAVDCQTAAFKFYETTEFSLFIVITAGIGNAVDVTRTLQEAGECTPGTINTWVFVNGKLSEEAYIHCLVTATEAKVKALQTEGIKDKVTGTLATGTSTDSILIAATQRGTFIPYGGTVTPLGKLVGSAVYECTIKALKNNRLYQDSL